VKPLREIVNLPPQGWRDICEEVVIATVDAVRGGYFNSIKPYSKHYKAVKTAGEATPPGVSQRSTSGKVDLTLTGDMLDGFKFLRLVKDGGLIGWDAVQSEKVEKNADMGRAITTDANALLPPVKKYFDKIIDTAFDRNAAKVSGRMNPIVIKL